MAFHQGLDVTPVFDSQVPGYLDLVPNEGYNHIAFFSPHNATKPIWITAGDWEVTGIRGIDQERRIVSVPLRLLT